MSDFGDDFPKLAERLSQVLSNAEGDIGFGGADRLELLAVVLRDASYFCTFRAMGARFRHEGANKDAREAEGKAEESYKGLPDEVRW